MVSKIPNDIFQYSTPSALMAGLATSGPTPSQLPGYGTHGIGTFQNLNGELLYYNGVAYQMTRDGRVRPAPPSTSLPFVQVTNFIPEFRTKVDSLHKGGLVDLFASGGSGAGGKNSFVPFVVKGKFEVLKLRIAGPQTSPDQSLTEVAAEARKWDLKNVEGVMFGVASPEWMQGVSVAGVHCHFMTDEVKGEEREGGHVLDFETGKDAEVMWAVTGRYHLGFPRDDTWEGLDLMADGEGLDKAEGSG